MSKNIREIMGVTDPMGTDLYVNKEGVVVRDDGNIVTALNQDLFKLQVSDRENDQNVYLEFTPKKPEMMQCVDAAHYRENLRHIADQLLKMRSEILNLVWSSEYHVPDVLRQVYTEIAHPALSWFEDVDYTVYPRGALRIHVNDENAPTCTLQLVDDKPVLYIDGFIEQVTINDLTIENIREHYNRLLEQNQAAMSEMP